MSARIVVVVAVLAATSGCSLAALLGAPVPCAQDEACPPGARCVDGSCLAGAGASEGEGEGEAECVLIDERFDDDDVSPLVLGADAAGGDARVEGGAFVVDLAAGAEGAFSLSTNDVDAPFDVRATLRAAVPLATNTQAYIAYGTNTGVFLLLDGDVLAARIDSSDDVDTTLPAGQTTLGMHVHFERAGEGATLVRWSYSLGDDDEIELRTASVPAEGPGFLALFGQAYFAPPSDPPPISFDDMQVSRPGPCP